MENTPVGHDPSGADRHGANRPTRALVALAAVGLLAGGVGAGFLLAGHGSPAAIAKAHLTSSTGVLPTGAAQGAKVTVSGTGVVTGTPDELTLQIGASSTQPTATAALDRNDAEVASLEAVLSSAGVTPADMQTSGLGLSPDYDSSGNVTGYQASDSLTVTITDLAKAGAVIDAAAHAVGNDVQIDGISFSIADTSPLLVAARTKAVEAAHAEAEAYATAVGASLGPVVSVADHEQPQIPVPMELRAASAAGTSTPVPVQPGNQQISVQVDVVYQLVGGHS